MVIGIWNFNNSYAALPGMFYTKQKPVPVKDPKLIIFNQPLTDMLDVPLLTDVYAGNAIPEGAEPIAQAYAGHQFGYFTMLGDGRAILLGEQITPSRERLDIQLKGAGQTPYSRNGDGRAALGPMLREYIISEAMHALNIPTTRSLAVVTTGQSVIREKILTGAILTRVASSHIRVGTFEYASHFSTAENVRALADYTIARHFPQFLEADNKYLLMLKAVIKGQAFLISKWQAVGFIHGVMNTDNMAISGETIDYGPCAFMDAYHPKTVFSSIDTQGRYAYGNQPKIAVWNIARFAETLLPLLHDNEHDAINIANEAIKTFWNEYNSHWLSGMKAKLGLLCDEAEDAPLINELLQLMQQYQADYTNTFSALTLGRVDESDLFSTHDFRHWHDKWQARIKRQDKNEDEISASMKKNNPGVIPRNHRVEEALEAAENGDLSVMHNLLHVLKNPYGYTPEQDEYTKQPDVEACCYKTFCGT